ncbi:MAG: RNA polymerase sigma factor [Clostridiales bacterium]|nr:RNA polymerase sigma factor [Clostridiales bacterium]
MEISLLLQHYDYLSRLAAAKMNSRHEAEDIVSDTMLAALEYIHRGGIIEHPRTFLANTLMHKYNDWLRRQYRQPEVINLDLLTDVGVDDSHLLSFGDNEEFAAEASELRRQLNYLAKNIREVLVGYYFAGRSVSDIAAVLGIPEGTVKSRLSSGRSQLKKGLSKMNTTDNRIPAKLHFSYGGGGGDNALRESMVERDLIAQNLIILAYDQPLALPELARRIGIPTVYIEAIVERLIYWELMAKTDGERYYTDFLILTPEDYVSRFDGQLDFVRENFDVVGDVISSIVHKVDELDFVSSFGSRKLKKLERYAVTRALQNFELFAQNEARYKLDYPQRRGGGAWIMHARKFEAGHDYSCYDEIGSYMIQGGHRSNRSSSCEGVKSVSLYEFDLPMWDNPRRFNVCGDDNYFNYIIPMLWDIYCGRSLTDSDYPNSLIESIPDLIEHTALLTRDGDKVIVDIPVMSRVEYNEIDGIVKAAYNSLNTQIGAKYRNFLKGSMVSVPPHLEASVPHMFRYMPATNCIAMSSVREACDRKIHLHDVDYCCPAVVLVYDL